MNEKLRECDKAPKTIYLQYDNGDDLPVTWASEPIYDTDVEYVRVEQTNTPKHETVSDLQEAYEYILRYRLIDVDSLKYIKKIKQWLSNHGKPEGEE